MAATTEWSKVDPAVIEGVGQDRDRGGGRTSCTEGDHVHCPRMQWLDFAEANSEPRNVVYNRANIMSFDDH